MAAHYDPGQKEPSSDNGEGPDQLQVKRLSAVDV